MKIKDKDRRSPDQKESVIVRMSARTKKKLIATAKRERRSVAAQAGLYVERALNDSVSPVN